MWKKGSAVLLEIYRNKMLFWKDMLFSAKVSEFSVVDKHYHFFKSHKIRVGRARLTTYRLDVA